EYADDKDAIFISEKEYLEKKAQIDEMVQKIMALEQRQRQFDENPAASREELQCVKMQLEKLTAALESLGEFLDTLRIRNDDVPVSIKVENNGENGEIEQPRWANLYSGLNRHRHKGKHTSAEFYQHKTNIISSLKAIYEPVGPTPTVDDLEEQPAALTVRLLKHQCSSLRWMQFRERQIICGGILADDMGLGKTLSMIALVLASEETEQKKRADRKRALEEKWTQEFHRFKVKKIPKFRMFDDESSEDEDEEEKYEPPAKRVCDIPEPEISESDDEVVVKETRYSKAATLVVCPMSVMCQWAQEVATKVAPNAIRVLTFHGPNRGDIGIDQIRSYDIVITSYNTVVSEYRKNGSASSLFAVHWNRVILDEAHIIRNVKTVGCISVCELKARCRWALTGTPVQNRAIDVFALMQFLGVPNFRDLQQWKKYLNEGMAGHRRLNFIIKPLMMRRTKQQLQATGDMPALPTLHVEMICVELSEQEMAVYQILSALSQKVFGQFLQQREKGNKDLNYYSSERTPQFIKDTFDAKYTEIYHRFLRSLGYNPREKLKGIVILVLLLRLRQFCCHPGIMIGVTILLHTADRKSLTHFPEQMLCGSMTAEDVQNVKVDVADVEGPLKMDVLAELEKYQTKQADSEEEDDDEERRPIIKLDDIKKEKEPWENEEEEKNWWENNDGLSSRHYSSDPLDGARALKLLNPQNPIFEFKRPSAKLKLIIEKIQEILTSTCDKIIVVSQWITFLAIIRKRLQDMSWETLDFTGRMNAKEREDVLRDFNIVNNDKRVLLLSLTAGGVGLNLNVANHLLLIDLHWNPQLERQAQDRIYRYGQMKPTYIYRFMCLDTIEQRIKALQDYKLEIAKVVLPMEEGGVSLRRVCGGGLNLAELKQLFSM
ncbi:hypothetical protein KR054_000204, partial [Drosophila jambulina]